MAGGKSAVPATVAEGIGEALRAVVSCQQAPDAVHFAGPLLEIQMKLLDLAHSMSGGGGGGQGGPQGGPPGGGGGQSPLMGGIAGMQGGPPQGPSAATSGAGPSSTGIDPEQLRQMALMGGNQ